METPAIDQTELPRPAPGIDWTLLAVLGPTGLLLGLAVVMGWFQRTGSEVAAWLVLASVWVVAQAVRRVARPMPQSLLTGLLAGLLFGFVPFLFFDAWRTNNPLVVQDLEAQGPVDWGMTRLMLLAIAMAYGLVFGLLTGAASSFIENARRTWRR